VVAFFGLMVLLVKACDHIIGPDDTVAAAAPSGDRDAAATGSTDGVDLPAVMAGGEGS